MAIQFENHHTVFTIGEAGSTLALADRLSGKNHCAAGAPLAHIRKGGQEHVTSAASPTPRGLRLEFGASGVCAELAVTAKDHYFIVEVISLQGEGVEELTFLDIPLALNGSLDEPFAACALALNLQTNVVDFPGPCARVRAACYPRFGFAGAKAALIACPPGEMRAAMQEAVSDAPDLPHSPLGGPWALDAPAARGSYLFNFGDVTEETVGAWIELIQALGFNQLDFHGGRSFRFGDCRLNPDMYPRGRASLKAVIDRLHAAGILAGLHTYAFFIDKSCPWVTPVPDRRLARDAAFTLDRALGPEDTVVTVAEPTGSMSTVTGFFVRNSVTLQIGDELVTYTGVSKEPPYAFTGCTRGALGTKAAAHDRGASVCHLKECFGLFAPDGDSSLLEEVAAATADTFNECGFDMMYLDALDGEDVLGGPENGWHYGSKFVFELWRRLNRPALMEMSTFHHHLWFVRSRLGAWDHPNRGHKRFIDLHVAANEGCRRMFLPAHLGWWAMKAWQGVQSEPTFTDDIEYLCGKCIGTDTGFSLMGIDPASFATSAAARRLAEIIKRYETLRHEGHFPEHVKARLREPGAEFRLEQCPDAKWRLRRTACAKHRIEALDGRSDLWRVRNEFSRQPIRLRIEALMSAAPYDDPDSVRLADFTDAAEFPESAVADGVAADLFSSDDQVRIGTVSGMFCAWRTRVPPRLLRRAARFSSTEHGVRVGAGSDVAWAKAGKTFQPPLDLGDRQALGMWIHGDGRGEILNVQTRSPEHVSGGIGDHYVVIDFRGWRYFELVETEGERVDDYGWPYSGQLYWIYREMVDYARLGSLSLWFNNIPPDGKVTCSLSPIKALRLVKATLRNPAITVGRHTLTFPVDIESGSYLEFGSPDDCRLYDPQGAVLCDVKPMGDAPLLEAGLNELRFTCEPPDGVRARVRVTVMSEGPTLEA